jgi:hypothetical protein
MRPAVVRVLNLGCLVGFGGLGIVAVVVVVVVVSVDFLEFGGVRGRGCLNREAVLEKRYMHDS